MKIKILFIALLISAFSWGQTTVTVSGLSTGTCPFTPTSTWTTPPTGLTLSNITRGFGVTCASVAGAITGTGFNGNLATNIGASKWYTYSVTSDATVTFSVSSLVIISRISTATGSPNVSVQYSIGAGPMTVIGSFTPTTSATTYTFTPATAISVGASQVLNIFIIPNTLSASTTTSRVENNSSITLATAPTGCTPPADPPTGAIISGTTPACTNTTLSSSATVSSPLFYYWQTSATGTNTANDAATPLLVASTNTYWIRTYNSSTSCWSTNSNTTSYPVTINAPVTITTQPSNQSATIGGSVTFTVAATGTALSYQWQFSTNGGSSWISVGANSASYTTPATVISDNGNLYRVVVSGTSPCNPVTSASATLYVCALTGILAAGTYAIPSSCFLTVASAASYLNTNGIAGPVVFNIAAGHSETAPSKGIGLGSATLNPTLSSSNTITFQKVGGTVTLNAGVGTGTPASASPDGILYLNGADNVTLDGLTFTDGNTTNPATMEFGVAFFKLNAGDGCNNNTVKNCTFNMQRVNGVSGSGPMFAGSWAIEVLNSTPAAATTNLTPTNGGTLATNGTNSGNKFYSNTTNGGYGGIGLSGFLATVGVGPAPTAATFLGDLNNDIGGTPAAGATMGNSILNYGGSSTNSTAGVRVNNQWGVNISNNTVNNNNGSGINHTTTLRGIFAQAGTSANATINYNIITVSSGATTSQLSGIENSIGATPLSNTVSINYNTIVTNYSTASSGPTYALYNNATSMANLNINNNTISLNSAATSGLNYIIAISGAGTISNTLNINNNTLTAILSANSTIATLRGIHCFGGLSTCATSISNNNFNGLTYTGTTGGSGDTTVIFHGGTPLSCTISNNNFNNLAIKTTGKIHLIYNTYTAPANGSKTISGNAIVGSFARTSGGTNGFYGYYDRGSSPSSVTHTITNNNFSNITIDPLSSGVLEGIDTEDFLSSNPVLNITGNTMSNWTNGSGGVYAIIGDGFAGTAGTPNIVSNNILNNISTQGPAFVYGVYIGSAANYVDVFNNSISQLKGLTSTTGNYIIGVFSAGADNVRIYKNNINGLSGIGSATIIAGIYADGAGSKETIYNNIIGDLSASASSAIYPGPPAVAGIFVFKGITCNIYNNTVYLSGTSSGTDFGTTALYAENTNTVFDVRNNILINTSTPKGLGRAAAFQTSLVYDPTYYSSTSNNNLFYAGTPGATKLIFYDGTNSDQTLTDFQTRVGATRDADSLTESFFDATTYFESIIGSNSLYLKPKSLCNVSSANNAGASIGSITDDYNSAIRDATTPDIGAWEFDSHGKRWNGTIDANWNTIKNWTPKGVPSATDCVFISAGTLNAAVISGDNYSALALNLTVENGASLTVNSGNTVGLGNTLTVTDSVIVANTLPAGSLLINNNSGLVQVTDVDNATTNSNSGDITYIRTTRAMRTYDYVYWGSPITKTGSFYQIPSAFDRYYKFVTTGGMNGTYTPLTTDNIAGQGYITRVKNDPLYTPTPSAINYSFVGTPNNGVVNITATNYDTSSLVSGNTILLGNPYPSAIDADAFIAANIKPGSPGPATITGTINQTIGGALYFWTSGTAYSGTGSYNFADYCTYTKLGTANGVPGTAVGGLNASGKIAAGQGFFAQIFASGQITFNNSMRVAGNNTNFFRNANSTTDAIATVEKHRIWLNYSSAISNISPAFRQMLIGYADGATNSFDNVYDGYSFTNNQIDLYSIVDNQNFSVQARALPFLNTDMVPLGFRTTTTGDYIINIDHVDGLFAEGQPIFLEDKELNIIHDLRTAPYSFNASAGRFDDRLVLRYTNAALGNPDFSIENSVFVATNHSELAIKSSIENIQEVTVYDMLGRELFKTKNINNNNFLGSNISLSQQTLIVKIKLENGVTISKKVIL
ncbi:T9SS sorting signal type C domain-containing protein [Flavobacterium sp.]|uniref:T9SS sorting signal type C domain-containing protein n=1 Tax=Flavobacterium sp. TaxID=239 RepID=UPI0025D9EB6E|nr:T9SS sorting signal type C domain-containing protein [Flavobacterium sp.]